MSQFFIGGCQLGFVWRVVGRWLTLDQSCLRETFRSFRPHRLGLRFISHPLLQVSPHRKEKGRMKCLGGEDYRSKKTFLTNLRRRPARRSYFDGSLGLFPSASSWLCEINLLGTLRGEFLPHVPYLDPVSGNRLLSS
jgi:hypothetical protein